MKNVMNVQKTITNYLYYKEYKLKCYCTMNGLTVEHSGS